MLLSVFPGGWDTIQISSNINSVEICLRVTHQVATVIRSVFGDMSWLLFLDSQAYLQAATMLLAQVTSGSG